MTAYEKDTLRAYRSAQRAGEYKRYNSSDWSWGRFVTWLEQRAIARELSRYDWTEADRLLDIPCGSVILGPFLHRFPFRITACDISPEMMVLARSEYPQDRLETCTQGDITKTPFPRQSFACVVTLGFLHRVPLEIKRETIREIAALSTKLVIASCSVDTKFQRFKHSLLKKLRPSHIPAPCPMDMDSLRAEFAAQGLRVVRAFMVAPPFSAHAVFALEK